MSTILTQKGHEKLVKELENLKKIERPAVIERIKNARELGDLSENADYSQAREEQSFIEGRIKEIEEKLKNAQVVDNSHNCGIVSVGHTIELDCSGKKEVYEIVGENESDPINGKISPISPIAQAILGKKLNDKIKISIPSGTKECQIVKIC
jgi:transcription elongation factor GreA